MARHGAAVCRNLDSPRAAPVLQSRSSGDNPMDLAFTPEEQAFREEIRAWVGSNLPADISQKVFAAQRLSRDDMQRWAKILGKKGWLGWGWPKEFGGRLVVQPVQRRVIEGQHRRFVGLLAGGFPGVGRGRQDQGGGQAEQCAFHGLAPPFCLSA